MYKKERKKDTIDHFLGGTKKKEKILNGKLCGIFIQKVMMNQPVQEWLFDLIIGRRRSLFLSPTGLTAID